MSRLAFGFVLVMLTALIVALSTGAQIYYLLALAMAMMLGVALISVATALFTLRASVRCPRRSVERGQNVPVVATVRHMSLLPVRSIALRLSLPGGADAPDALELTALPFVTRRYELSLAAPHRGTYAIGVTAVSATDVFGLFTFSRRAQKSSFQVEVLPRARRLSAMPLNAGDTAENRLARMTEDNASPADVRGWVQGDALKKVHWKLSMRKRELMVRTYEESARPDTLLLLDLYPLNALKSHALTIEDAVCETAAALARAQLAEGYPVRMPLLSAHPTEVAGEGESALGRFVTALARVAFDSPYPFEQVLMLEMRRLQRTGGAVLITPRLTPRIADLSLQLKRGGMQVTVCWITDNRREEADRLMSRLGEGGLRAYRIDPWGEGLTEEQMIGNEVYG